MHRATEISTQRQSLRVLIAEALAMADECEPLVAIHLATAIDALDRAMERTG